MHRKVIKILSYVHILTQRVSKEKLPRDPIYTEQEYLLENYVSYYAVFDSHLLEIAKITKEKGVKIKVSKA